MTKKPEHNQDYWEEIFESVEMDFLPLEYVNTVIVKFNDGKIWEIAVDSKDKENLDIETALEDFFEEYQSSIDTVDFRLNTDKLKHDISKRTKRFLKLNR